MPESDVMLALNRAKEIEPMLKDLPPGVQGAVLAQLLAIWLVGHQPPMRQALLEDHVTAVCDMVPAIIKERRKPAEKHDA